MKTSIALIGFMATGKTEVAKVLAQKSDKTLIDLDAIIVKNAGKSILDIFRQAGGQTVGVNFIGGETFRLQHQRVLVLAAESFYFIFN